jgi:hypothetical protein
MRDLRRELVGMRGRLVGRLAQRLGGGDLALLGTVVAALAAVDRTAIDGPIDSFASATVVDEADGSLALMLRGDDPNAVVRFPLAPIDAVALAGELIVAALPRLAAEAG